jgi:tRNA(adenine34) deaminase
MSEHDKFMAIAMEEALAGVKEGEQPFGACVVRDGEVICRAHSIKVNTHNITAHAETRAVGLATEALKINSLAGCTFYSVCEPCPMCCGAILNSQVSALVLGARLANLKNFSGDQFSSGQYDGGTFDFHEYSAERLAELVGSKIQVIEGVMEEECENLYRNAQGKLSR